jgi:hypothetical protein
MTHGVHRSEYSSLSKKYDRRVDSPHTKSLQRADESAEDIVPLPVFFHSDTPDDTFLAHLLEHSVRCVSACLKGFTLIEVAGGRWSVLVEDDDSSVDGRVLTSTVSEDLGRLDFYQGVGEGLYRRVRVEVMVGADERAPAYAYLPTEHTLSRLNLV